MKYCLQCGRELLPPKEMYCSPPCKRRRWYLQHKELEKERAANWSRANPEKSKESKLRYYHSWSSRPHKLRKPRVRIRKCFRCHSSYFAPGFSGFCSRHCLGQDTHIRTFVVRKCRWCEGAFLVKICSPKRYCRRGCTDTHVQYLRVKRRVAHRKWFKDNDTEERRARVRFSSREWRRKRFAIPKYRAMHAEGSALYANYGACANKLDPMVVRLHAVRVLSRKLYLGHISPLLFRIRLTHILRGDTYAAYK